MNERHYDAIVVGGRPAGSTLAARLGKEGLRVLLLERASFPSAPAASSPAIYSPALKLLDEIGADEADYARGTPPIRRWVTEFRDSVRAFNPVPNHLGRDYGYAIDRVRFDDALWRHAARFPSVRARQQFAVADLVWEDGRVTGIRGRAPGGPEEVFTAGCVVGADGRFSLVARKVNAQVLDERSDLPTTVYYAYWRHAEPYDDEGPCIHTFGPGYGYGFLLMDSADGTLGVVIEGQSAILNAEAGGAEALYLRLLMEQPRLWRRLAGAQRVTEVRGMKRIGNLYRTGGGPGWALTGDAVHQKDPLDGQGVYDALFTAKALSQAIVDWHRGNKTWTEAMAAYEAETRAETYPVYVETLNRVKRDLYTRQPEWVLKWLVPWLLDDPDYKRLTGLIVVRGVPPGTTIPETLIRRAALRGLLADLRRWASGRPRPSAMPPPMPSSARET